QDVAPAGHAVDPAGAQNEVGAARLPNGVLASKLAVPIDIEGTRWVILRIRPILAAIEDVVARVVDKEHTGPPGFLRQDTDSRTVDLHRPCVLILCVIDRRIGGGVHDDIGLEAADETGNPLRPQQIAPLTIERHHVPKSRKAAGKLRSDLAFGSCDQQSHDTTIAPQSGPPASELLQIRHCAERGGSSSLSQPMPAAGSVPVESGSR